ncbi:MAG: ATP-binding protein [Pseudohongiellaceae bacterium]
MASLTRHLKGYRTRIVVQTLLLALSIFLLCFSLLLTDWIGTPVLCAGLIILFSYNLVTIAERSYNDFAQFISNVYYNDFSSTSSLASADEASRRFLDAQKVILGTFRKLKADRSAQHEYLQLIVEHVDTALISFDEHGRIEVINQAAKNLLRTRHVVSLSRIHASNPELAVAIESLRAGDQRSIKVTMGDEIHNLILTATEFRLMETDHKLVSMQNIKSALDEKEIESWQKLIRVLTHEIMNSMTPIVSLSNYLKKVVGDREQMQQLADNESEQYHDVSRSIESIASRSEGLIGFVDAYRTLSNLPRPDFGEISLERLFSRIETLFKEKLNENNIVMESSVKPRGIVLTADINQLEQVLMNLVSNALDAFHGKEEGKIQLDGFRNANGKTVIQVRDNGEGISREVMENIFTPFFTTKSKGTGIGLSLSRQLARLNKGSLTASSIAGSGSVFNLTFQ